MEYWLRTSSELKWEVINMTGEIKWLISVEYLKQFLAHSML